MKKSDKSIENLFASARFEVQDDGFSKRVMSKLPFVPIVDKKAIWRQVFGRVSIYAAACLLVALFIYSKLDYQEVSAKVYASTLKIEQKAATMTNNISKKFDKSAENNENK